MAYEDETKSAAELQREIELQRSRVEDTIDQIQQKLSPGQMVDELLAYTKGGGGEFVTTLQRQVTSNPLPVALLGVSLAWLMAKPPSTNTATVSNTRTSVRYTDRQWDESISANRGYTAGAGDDYDYGDDDYEYEDIDYPVTSVSGSIRRTGFSNDESGNRFSHFVDDAGKKFRAATDAQGRRAGHFMDDAGNRFKGFTDSAGGGIQHIRDEAGNLLDEATNWASHTWRAVRRKMHDARDTAGRGVSDGRHHVGRAGSAMQHQAGRAGSAVQHQFGNLNDTIISQFRDQPLVGGALAFALGAALGSALPHTDQEDALLGEAADNVKGMAGEQAAGLYEQGRQKTAEIYEAASGKAGEVLQQAKDGLSGVTEGSSGTGGSSTGSSSGVGSLSSTGSGSSSSGLGGSGQGGTSTRTF